MLGDGPLRLDATQLQVVLRQVRNCREGDAAPVLDRGLRVGVGGLRLAAHPAEQVEVPGGVEAILEHIELQRRAGLRNDDGAGIACRTDPGAVV